MESFTFENPYCQRFSLPENIVYYIAQNPISSSAYQKLVQACKYFYSKNPIIVVEKIDNENKEILRLNKGWESKSLRISDLNQISCKFWVSGYAYTVYSCPRFIEILLQKCIHLNWLYFYFENITFERYSSIKNAITKLKIFVAVPQFADGRMMPLEDVFEFFPNLESFEM